MNDSCFLFGKKKLAPESKMDHIHGRAFAERLLTIHRFKKVSALVEFWNRSPMKSSNWGAEACELFAIFIGRGPQASNTAAI